MQHLQKIGGGVSRLPRPQILQSSNVPLSDSLIHLFHFFILHTLLCHGISSVLLESIPCGLFPSRRGVAPFRHTRLPRGDSFSVSVNSVLSATSVLIPPLCFTAHSPLLPPVPAILLSPSRRKSLALS